MKTVDVVFTWGGKELETLEMTPKQYQEALIFLGEFKAKQELLEKCKKCPTTPN
jgi:hypothetical protein